jgi:hypothetical protein
LAKAEIGINLRDCPQMDILASHYHFDLAMAGSRGEVVFEGMKEGKVEVGRGGSFIFEEQVCEIFKLVY